MVPKATCVVIIAFLISVVVAQDVEPQYPEDFKRNSTTMVPPTKPPIAITSTTKATKTTTTAATSTTPKPPATTSSPPTSSTTPTTEYPTSTVQTTTFNPPIITTPIIPTTTFGGYSYYNPRPQRPLQPQQPEQPTYPLFHNHVDCFKPKCYYKEDRQIVPRLYWNHGRVFWYYPVDCYHCCRFGETGFAGCNKVDHYYCKQYFK